MLLGATRVGNLGGSAYWAENLGFVGGAPPEIDLEAEARLQRLLADAAARHLLHSAHDCSAGGLSVTLAEAAMGGPYQPAGFGAEMDLSILAGGLSTEELLFGETGARVIVSCAAPNLDQLLQLAQNQGVPAYDIGLVGPPDGDFVIQAGAATIWRPIRDLRTAYFEAIPKRMGQIAVAE